jgi:hypothetical protein
VTRAPRPAARLWVRGTGPPGSRHRQGSPQPRPVQTCPDLSGSAGPLRFARTWVRSWTRPPPRLPRILPDRPPPAGRDPRAPARRAPLGAWHRAVGVPPPPRIAPAQTGPDLSGLSGPLRTCPDLSGSAGLLRFARTWVRSWIRPPPRLPRILPDRPPPAGRDPRAPARRAPLGAWHRAAGVPPPPRIAPAQTGPDLSGSAGLRRAVPGQTTSITPLSMAST